VFLDAAIDAKNALRTFLTSSSDFTSDGAAQRREVNAAVMYSNSARVAEVVVTSGTRTSPPPVTACVPSVRPTRDSNDHEVRSASNTDRFASHFLPASCVETTVSVQKSPRQPAACLPATTVFPSITDIARFSINSTGHPPLAVPFLVAGAAPVEPGIRGRQIFGALAVTSVPQPPSSLSSLVLPAGFMARTALRLPLAPVQPALSIVTTTSPLLQCRSSEQSASSSQVPTTSEDQRGPCVEHMDHQNVPTAVNWKLKMARDHVSDSELTF